MLILPLSSNITSEEEHSVGDDGDFWVTSTIMELVGQLLKVFPLWISHLMASFTRLWALNETTHATGGCCCAVHKQYALFRNMITFLTVQCVVHQVNNKENALKLCFTEQTSMSLPLFALS